MAKGRLEVVCGSMFSGKSEELMRRLKRAEYAKQGILTVKHRIDDRGSYSCIKSHDGRKREAQPIDNSPENLASLLTLANGQIDVVGIDEVQFFSQEIVGIIHELVERGKRVIVAGLDMNFRGEPFSHMPELLAICEQVTKLHAICMSCGKDANFTQRLIDGKPAKYDDPTILVGATECYEARCRDCFEIDQPAIPLAESLHA